MPSKNSSTMAFGPERVFFKVKRVMITGGSTALGIALVEAFLADPEIEIILALGHHEDHPLPAAGAKLHYSRVNLTRIRSLRTLLFGLAKELRIDTVADVALHLESNSNAGVHYSLNVDVTRQILLFAERHPTIKRFVVRSHAEAYDHRSDLPTMLAEDHPLNLSPENPMWLRQRIEADLTVCARMGMSPLSIAVLRCAECLAPGVGSQLYDIVSQPMPMRPWGYDPMMNVLSLPDLVRAMQLAVKSDATGVFNIPGADTLPLSELFSRSNPSTIALPSPVLGPAYALRSWFSGKSVHYRSNHRRFHLGGVLDGSRAKEVLNYEPQEPIRWLSRS